MTPALDRFDHVHVFVSDRVAAERWYADVMGLVREPELERWATGGGPLTLTNGSGTVHVALFERSPQPCRSTVALSVGAEEFCAWRKHLAEKLERPIELDDHELSWSLYFSDPDGNPWEITCYQHAVVSTLLEPMGT